jgi:hypothetical protein
VNIATWPAPIRHLLLAVATVLITWGGTDLVPWLHDQGARGALAAAVVAALLAVATPLVNSYGIGKRNDA